MLHNDKVAVLMATHNGMPWLLDQIETILGQSGVDVLLYVSDDASTDGSVAWIKALSEKDARVILLPQGQRFGSAAKNFYRLIQDIKTDNCSYIAYSDQDDVWEQDKLIRQIELIQQHCVDGISSNVTAFWPNGKKKLINKSQAQRELDYLFESAGPGCTFLMTPWLVNELRRLLNDSEGIAREVVLHDWLAYAVCRASGRKWFIDSTPTVLYRQHDRNVLGANSGVKAKFARLKKIHDGWYRNEVFKIVQICSGVSHNPRLQALYESLNSSDFKSRVNLLRFVSQARRCFYDRVFLAVGILVGLF